MNLNEVQHLCGLLQKNEEDHFHIVLTDPMPDADSEIKVIIVNTTSIKDKKYNKKIYVLKGGGHPDITYDSYIYYKKVKLITVKELENDLNSGKIKTRRSFDIKEVKEIAKGLRKATNVSKSVRDFYRDYRIMYNENRKSRSGFMYTKIKEDEWKKPSIWEIDLGKNSEWKRDIWD